MKRFFSWLFDDNGYYIIAAVIIISIFALGAYASCCDNADKDKIEYQRQQASRMLEIREHRQRFYNQYKQNLRQFDDFQGFNIWLDEADHESIVLLHSLICTKSREYAGDEGFGYMVDYLGL